MRKEEVLLGKKRRSTVVRYFEGLLDTHRKAEVRDLWLVTPSTAAGSKVRSARECAPIPRRPVQYKPASRELKLEDEYFKRYHSFKLYKEEDIQLGSSRICRKLIKMEFDNDVPSDEEVIRQGGEQAKEELCEAIRCFNERKGDFKGIILWK